MTGGVQVQRKGIRVSIDFFNCALRTLLATFSFEAVSGRYKSDPETVDHACEMRESKWARV